MKRSHNKQKIPRLKNYKKKKLNYKKYSSMCKFRFDLKNYPQEFDLELLEKHGWYCPKNNPNALTRDHMLSISYGWKRDISPKILSHPANCQLMFYENNLDKAWRSSINCEELMKRIEKWEKKYKYLNK